MAIIFDLLDAPVSDSAHTGPNDLLDPEYVGAAFEIPLLSCK